MIDLSLEPTALLSSSQTTWDRETMVSHWGSVVTPYPGNLGLWLAEDQKFDRSMPKAVVCSSGHHWISHWAPSGQAHSTSYLILSVCIWIYNVFLGGKKAFIRGLYMFRVFAGVFWQNHTFCLWTPRRVHSAIEYLWVDSNCTNMSCSLRI